MIISLLFFSVLKKRAEQVLFQVSLTWSFLEQIIKHFSINTILTQMKGNVNHTRESVHHLAIIACLLQSI